MKFAQYIQYIISVMTLSCAAGMSAPPPFQESVIVLTAMGVLCGLLFIKGVIEDNK